MQQGGARHNPARYQGKNLVSLLAAMFVPAGILFLGMVFEFATGETRLTPAQYQSFGRAYQAAYLLFVPAQLISAVYLQRLFPAWRLPFAKVLQYCAALTVGLLLSTIEAVMLMAFGSNLFLRVTGHLSRT